MTCRQLTALQASEAALPSGSSLRRAAVASMVIVDGDDHVALETLALRLSRPTPRGPTECRRLGCVTVANTR